jgi:regulatory protein
VEEPNAPLEPLLGVPAARRVALALLTRRDFSCAELRTRLQALGVHPVTIDETIAALREERALDDARFAESYAAGRAARGQGPLRIERELRDRGVAAELIEVALAAAADWAVLASNVRARRFGPEVPEEPAERARQARFLQYRGFSSDHIRLALGPDLDLD